MHPSESVTIIGAGPAGLCCALWLVRAGIPVTVLEKETGLPEDMRASTFHPATLDLLDESGISRSLIGQGTRVPKWQYLQHETGERVVFDLSSISDATAHPYRLQVEQFRLTNAIVARLRDEPGFKLLRGAQLTVVEPEGETVRLSYEHNGEMQYDQARWLIAADGAHSVVRKQLGLSFEGSVFPRTSITLVLDHRFQDDTEELLGVNYVWTADGHFSLMRVRDLWRFSFSPRDEENPVEAHDREAAEARLQSVFPKRTPYRIQQLNHYTLHQRCLAAFRRDNVLFCGDAAHLNSPAGGMGMNSGIHDAACLVDHLLPVLAGKDEALLDRYDRRRRTIALEEVQRLSTKNYKRHRETDPERRVAIWDKLQATASDPARQREFLLDSSMIASLRREAEIA
ncbi:MAG: NAD(P)/FAD-dependent oxidoreductase [Pseudomonadota bacterium]